MRKETSMKKQQSNKSNEHLHLHVIGINQITIECIRKIFLNYFECDSKNSVPRKLTRSLTRIEPI